MLIDIISGVIQPTLGVLAATGIIQGLLALFNFLGWIPDTSGAYQIWYAGQRLLLLPAHHPGLHRGQKVPHE